MPFTLKINPESMERHEKIMAICKRDQISYPEAFNKFYEEQNPTSSTENLSAYNPVSVRTHRIVEAIVDQYGFDYPTAYQKYVEVTRQGKVPLLDWSKVKLN